MKPLGDSAITRLRAVTQQPDFSGTRYSLVREIARGGMGVVYEAEDRELARRVAIKVVPVEDNTAPARGRLRDEATTIAGLEHPGIVPVFDAGELPDGRAWYAMKLVQGRTLSAVIGDSVPLADLLRIFVRVCETAGFAHARGRIHGDLKPDNIMVAEFGEVLVMDWGGGAVGTSGFMAPEQERRQPVDARADVFALGRILAVATQRESSKPLRSIIARTTAPSPEDRYQDAASLGADVLRLLDGERVLAHRETVVERADRWLLRHRALVAMVLAYMIMRAVVFLWTRL